MSMKRETADEKLERLTRIERALWAGGKARVAGIDEVGRGPLAGPVVAACVCMPPDALLHYVDDSKKLTQSRREALYEQIKSRALCAYTAWVDETTIDQINILNATRRAMEECGARASAEVYLIDAVEGLKLPGEARAIIKGDAISYMIAAASIIAKVERDRYMIELDDIYPQYGFMRNKGYGTSEHIRALREHGPCPAHRLTFIKSFIGGGA